MQVDYKAGPPPPKFRRPEVRREPAKHAKKPELGRWNSTPAPCGS